MRSSTVAIAAFGIATCIAAVGTGLDAGEVQHGAEAVAMLALAAYTALVGRAASWRLLGALLAFCLLLAAAALVTVTAGQVPLPEPVYRNGCPVDTAETTAYWQDQLRRGQLAEVLRFVALLCALQAVRVLPRSPRPTPGRRRVTAVLLAVLVLAGIAPIVLASDSGSLLLPTAPAVLTLGAAAVLVGLTMTRVGGRPADNAALVVGVILILLSAASGPHTLVDLHDQLPEPERPGVIVGVGCLLSLRSVAAFDLTPVFAFATIVTTLIMTAPAMVAWSAIQPRPPSESSA